MSYDHVIYEKRGHVAHVTLNRPERMNALDRHSHVELIEIFDDFAHDDDAWVAIVTGAGERAFCAGNDLKATAQASADGEQRVDSSSRFAAITRAYDCPKPLIAAVNGVAAGGGFEIALACDIVVAADSARFGLPEPRVGLIAGAGGIHRLSRQIPLKQAMGMLLTGRLVSADEGYRLGFVNEVVPAAELMAAAQRWASEILECSPLLVQLTKESAHDGFGRPVDEAIARDWEDRIPRLLASQDYVEGPKAFSERRKPVWTGS
jgi:enoyl-CoA hydratase/carnithine racemase